MTTALISVDCCIVKHNGRIVIPIRPDHVGALKNPLQDLTTAPFVYVTDDPQLIGRTYDRERAIENIWRVYAIASTYPGVYFTTAYGVYSGIRPKYVNYYEQNPITFDPKGGFVGMPSGDFSTFWDVTTGLDHQDINPDARIIGQVGDMLLPCVDKAFGQSSQYLFNDAVKDMLHRDTLVLDTQNDSIDALIEFIQKRNGWVFIKNALNKDVSGVVDTDNFDKASETWALTDYKPDLEEALIALVDPEHNEQFQMWGYRTPRFVCVQEARPLQYETRFFCVGGRIVSAAGRIINYTPDWDSNNDPYAYADVATINPSEGGDGEQPRCNPYYTQMREVAENNVKTILADNLDMDTFVMDMAWDAILEQPVLVEINGLSNAGFYGASPRAIYYELVPVENSANLTYRVTQDYIAKLLDTAADM